MKTRAPEPTEQEIEKAARATARQVFTGSKGGVTLAYYRRLKALGIIGEVAMNLFRAQKTSTRAKKYRGRRYVRSSYDVKNYSLSELCRVLERYNTLAWGWGRDYKAAGYTHVLYVEIPTGQVSFHSPQRGSGPDYPRGWDGIGDSENRILSWCDLLLTGHWDNGEQLRQGSSKPSVVATSDIGRKGAAASASEPHSSQAPFEFPN